MRFELPTLDDLIRLLESLEQHPLGALLLVALILSVAVPIYSWRWAPKGTRSRTKAMKAKVEQLR